MKQSLKSTNLNLYLIRFNNGPNTALKISIFDVLKVRQNTMAEYSTRLSGQQNENHKITKINGTLDKSRHLETMYTLFIYR